jgi:hypothetical protein
VMEMFPVSLSPVSKMGSLGVMDSQQVIVGQVAPQDLSSFWGSCRWPISPILPKPTTWCYRSKKKYSGPVRRSRRIGGWFTAGTPVWQQ